MAAPNLTILGIETSCDETAAALVRRHANGEGEILSNVILSQVRDHAPYGGVVPEIAARAHASHLDRLIKRGLAEARVTLDDIDGVAATAGPGLIGGLLVGLTTAKAIALAKSKPLLAINHLEAHALTPRLLAPLAFPYLLLLISGGHTQLQIVEGVGRYRRIGTTIDDALGEAFDKTAKLLGLPYPGGPQVEALAHEGNARRFDFPRPLKGRAGCDFSFSGLKTAIRETVEELGSLGPADKADICAGFEAAIADTMRDRLSRALKLFKATFPDVRRPALVVAGGVAANRTLQGTFDTLATHHGFALVIPPPHLCTDNAAMVAWAGAERLVLGLADPLEAEARARWPLDPEARRMTGAGVKA
jgi:N6-L-threonylcarbamoyladenine synthase